MATVAIEGMQWGDEGKGKVTDYFASRAEIVVRSQGGNNAGHSIEHHGVRYALQLLPSGILNKGVVNVLADGMVINPIALLDEIKRLRGQGVEEFNIMISNRASVLLPYHIELDRVREAALGKAKIGTTGKGIGPCYEDKASRTGLRMGDLLEEEYLIERLESSLAIKNKELTAFGGKNFTVEEIMDALKEAREYLAPYICDTSVFLRNAVKEGKKICFEGAQGALLCITHGTYPYVTSSSPLATAIPVNTGLPLTAIDDVVGIMKAYSTRVGEGPFPTELDGDIAKAIRDKGHEYGTVTKRPRRVGWLDVPQLKYVAGITGIKHVCLMLLDVLDVVDEIKICTEYKINGKVIDYVPSTVKELARVEPTYISVPSWKEDISGITSYDELPENCKAYIAKIEELTGTEICMVSVGPDKDATIIRKEMF